MSHFPSIFHIYVYSLLEGISLHISLCWGSPCCWIWQRRWPFGPFGTFGSACCLSPTAVGSFDLRRGAGPSGTQRDAAGWGGPWYPWYLSWWRTEDILSKSKDENWHLQFWQHVSDSILRSDHIFIYIYIRIVSCLVYPCISPCLVGQIFPMKSPWKIRIAGMTCTRHFAAQDPLYYCIKTATAARRYGTFYHGGDLPSGFSNIYPAW